VPSCNEVAQAAALVISLWIQSPSVQVPDRAPSREGTDEAVTTRRLSDIEPDTPNRASGARARSRLRLRRDHFGAAPGRSSHGHFALGMAVLAGALPSPSWGLTGRAGVSLGAWRIEGLFLWLDKRQVLAPASPSLGGEFGLLASGMRIAYALPVTAFLNVQPGIWSLIGRLHGDGIGTLTRSTPSNDGWGAAGLGLEASLSIGHVSLSLGGGNGLPFGRPRFLVGDTLLYRTQPVTWFAHLLGTVAFPWRNGRWRGILVGVSFYWLATATALPLASPLSTQLSSATVDPELAPPLSVSQAFDSVYELYFDFVWRNLRRLGVEESSVDDAAHDVFLVVYKQLARFDGRNHKSWLFAIAQRVAWHYRRAYARRRTDPLAEESLRDESAPCPDQAHEQREARDVVNDLLEQLSDERRVVFVLSELEQMSTPQIATMLRIPLNTAYSRLRLARRDFSHHLKRHEQKISRSVPWTIGIRGLNPC
jgi:RNA polymerase sigma-70 factor, ECF subfamily